MSRWCYYNSIKRRARAPERTVGRGRVQDGECYRPAELWLFYIWGPATIPTITSIAPFRNLSTGFFGFCGKRTTNTKERSSPLRMGSRYPQLIHKVIHNANFRADGKICHSLPSYWESDRRSQTPPAGAMVSCPVDSPCWCLEGNDPPWKSPLTSLNTPYWTVCTLTVLTALIALIVS